MLKHITSIKVVLKLQNQTVKRIHAALATLILGIASMNGATAVAADAKGAAYKLDPQQSEIKWLGKKVTGQHNGSVQFQSGELWSDGRNLTGGKFTVDMPSITVED